MVRHDDAASSSAQSRVSLRYPKGVLADVMKPDVTDQACCSPTYSKGINLP